MRTDPGSNYTLGEEVAANAHAPGTINGAGVDHAKAPSVSFLITVGNINGGTLDAKVQYANASDFSDAVDYPAADEAGNDDAIVQMTANGIAQLNVPNPRGRYSRVVLTPAVAAVTAAVVSVLGPNRHVALS